VSRFPSPIRSLVVALLVLVAGMSALLSADPARALTAIEVGDQDRIDLAPLGQVSEGRGDSFQIEIAAGPDGVAGRMAVRTSAPGSNPNWFVFALTNPTDRTVERWLTAERYSLIGSGVIWPDLDARRIEGVTPSIGYLPERVRSERADIFRLTIDPGQTVTYAVELAPTRFAGLQLWKPLEYEVKARDRLLFNGTLLGITGVLGVFLTAVFAANHKAIFPAAALVAWCVLGYLTVDFGSFHKLFNLRAEDNAVYRAATEAAMAASIVIFLHTFLRLGSWHGFIRMLTGVWIVAQLALVGLAVIDPRLAATFARVSFVVIAGIGALITLFLALRGQDRALMLVPTWILFLVWIFGVGVALNGRLSGDLVVSGLLAGLGLIVVLLGFTVTQFAFRSQEAGYVGQQSDVAQSALAIDGAGAAVWEWNARRDEVSVGPAVEALLGLAAGELSRKTDEFMRFMHPADREKFRLSLFALADKGSGTIRTDFRLRHADNSYRWFDLDAATVGASEQRAVRCVGLMRDITDTKRSQERLMHDAVHDGLTKLPNRQLFLDRLANAVKRGKTDPMVRPTVLFIDIDRFKSVNTSFGLVVGDSLLLTVARRIDKHLGPDDTLARVGGDQFAILMLGQHEPRELAMLAERIRRSLRAPIKIVGQDVVLTGSIGIAIDDGSSGPDHDLLKEAEIAMFRAKREGNDRIEIFRSDMRVGADDVGVIESDLRQAIERKQLKVFYQPIVYLPTEELVGFEALLRWDHPKRGRIDPGEFVKLAEQSNLIGELGLYALNRALADHAVWLKELPRPERPLFVSINVSARQIFRTELVQELRQALNAATIQRGTVRLEVTESVVMENPEQATEALSWLKATGVDLALDDFGTGYSSLAYLQRFPVDTIKIDRSLVEQGVVDTAGAAIVRSVVALAAELGKKVVAEGIEEGEDAAFLRSIGCEYGQGFYFGEAMPERDVVTLLRSLRKTESKLRRRGFFRTKSAPDAAKTAARRAERKASAAAAAAAAASADAPPLPANEEPALAAADQSRAPAPAAKTLSQLPASKIRARRPAPAGPPPVAPSNGATRTAPSPPPFAARLDGLPSGQRPGGPPTQPPPLGPRANGPSLPPLPSAAAEPNVAALTTALADAVTASMPPEGERAPAAASANGPPTLPPGLASAPYIPPLPPGAPAGPASAPPPFASPLGSRPAASLSALPPLTLPPLPEAPATTRPTQPTAGTGAARKSHLPAALARSLSRLAGEDGGKT